MTFILLPGAVAIHGSDSVSMKREASASSGKACAMVSSSGRSTRINLRAGDEAVHRFMDGGFSRKLVVLALGAFVWASLALPADHARSQAARPIRLIISVPPGGSIDLLVRVLADHISTTKGQSIIVESRPGAGGVIAAEAVARAPPDGSTLLVNNNGMIITAILRKVNYDPRASFEPICYLVTTPQIIAVNGASPYRTLTELFDQEVKAKLTAQALYHNPKCGAEYEAHIARQSDLYGRLIRELNIKAE